MSRKNGSEKQGLFHVCGCKRKDTLGSICVVLEIIADDNTDEKEHPAMCIFFGYV